MIGGLSMTELMIILGLALLLLGPDQLPTIARSLGKGIKELRKATDDIKSQFESEIARIDLDDTEKTRRMIAPAPPPAPAAGETPDDPAAARANARAAATTTPTPPVAEDDPAAARAAARRAATETPLRLVAPEGTVPARDQKP
jgi:sec-independent protein translocase protein TatB